MMAKKQRREDTEILLFAFKLVGMLALVLMVAIGIDISHASHAIKQAYGQPL